VAPPLRPAALEDGADDEVDVEAPAVLTVFHHGKQVATVRPFDRRNTRANGRRAAATNGAKAPRADEFDDTDEELPERFLISGDGD
jgi:hypothetical protein